MKAWRRYIFKNFFGTADILNFKVLLVTCSGTLGFWCCWWWWWWWWGIVGDGSNREPFLNYIQICWTLNEDPDILANQVEV